MNKPIRFLALVSLLLFMALMINTNVVQVLQADELNAREGNRRVIDEEFNRERGAILVDGTAIAESVPSDGQWQFQRQYPSAELYAPITGYFSYVYGRGGLEASENGILSGSDNRLFVDRVVDLLANSTPQGGSIELTIDPAAQIAASEGLRELGQNTRGSVVALNPQTGEILAMVTQPSYDPNQLASHDLAAVQQAWQELNADENNPMSNRGAQLTLPPGSTFKLVTAAAALENLNLTPESMVQGGTSLTFPGIEYTLPNQGGSNCGGDQITLARALAVSCNVSFGALAGEVGDEAMAEQAAAFGFGEQPLTELPSSASRFPTGDLEAPQLAQSGIGQFEVAATPLQMAMVAAGIANDGVVMQPHVVKTVRAPNLQVLDEIEPEVLSQAMSRGNAQMLQDMMVEVVDSGTGGPAAIPGVGVGGKTGTAESAPGRPPYAWFVSFAPADNPEVAVAVLVESLDGNTSDIAGGRLGGPIARSVMEAVLR